MDEKIFIYFSEENYSFFLNFSSVLHSFSFLNDFTFCLFGSLSIMLESFYKYLVNFTSLFTF